MTRTIPRLLAGIPVHDAADVGAGGGAFVDGSGFILVNGQLAQAFSHQRALAGGDLVN